MTYKRLPDDLADRLRAAGLDVVEIPGWRQRGRPASTGEFKPVGMLNHHTGARDVLDDSDDDLAYSRWMTLQGRPDLPPPLSQLALSLEGTVYVQASGRANHAGIARPSGSVAGGDGNALYVGMEWMLSGTQEIPDAMYRAGVAANAVILDILGSSVQAVSCHYQTSVTGKWDIGDPHGIEFGPHRVLNVPRFREAVKRHRNGQRPPADTFTIDFMHASLQFSDTAPQKRRDIEDLFARASRRRAWWITGTEAGPGAAPNASLLQEVGADAGYRLWVPSLQDGRGAATDCWVAVAKERIDDAWTTSFLPAIPGSKALYVREGFPESKASDMRPRWAPKGLVNVGFFNEDVGARVSVGAGHYLTQDQEDPADLHGVDHGEWNETFAGVIGEWAAWAGAGRNLAFYGGDQNINDRRRDTFYGSPLTSLQDELAHWEATGHGPIDVLATYDNDGRVAAKYVRALDDREFPQHGDHFVVEGGVTVRRLRAE